MFAFRLTRNCATSLGTSDLRAKDQKVLAKQQAVATRAFEPIYQQLRQEFDADNSFATVAFVEKYWRIAGNTGFNESIYHVEKILQQAGFKKEEKGESDATLTYRIESRKMKRPT